MDEFTVYILFSAKFNEIYIGYSSNIDARFFLTIMATVIKSKFIFLISDLVLAVELVICMQKKELQF
jgi:hypothetical protein